MNNSQNKTSLDDTGIEYQKKPKTLLYLLIIAFGILSSVFTWININAKVMSDELELSKIKTKVLELEEISNQTQKQKQEDINKYAKDVVGIDNDRVQRDSNIIKEFAKKMFTWSTYDEYESNRQEATKKYSLPPRSSFLTKYMPFIPDKVAPNGVHYNHIKEDNLNSTFKQVQSYVIGKDKTGDYHYIAFVKFTSSTSLGAVGTGDLIIMFQINSLGELNKADAYAIHN